MKGRIRQRSPGSWEITYDLPRDGTGRRRRRILTVHGTKAEAQRQLRQELAVLDQGGNPGASSVIMADWLDRWIVDFVAHTRRLSTKERYEETVRRYLKPHLGFLPVAQVAPAHIQDMEAELGKRVSAKTIGNIHNILSAAMKQALRLELINRNPVTMVTPPTVKRREVVPPDVYAVRQALAVAREEGLELYPAMHLIAYTGLRRGEALGLLWEHVDLERGFLRVESSVTRTKERGLSVEPPKTAAGRRVVDLDAGTVEVLAAHRRRSAAGPDGRGIVFPDEAGGWLHPERLTRAVKRMGAMVGRKDMTVRSLRHFHASVMLQAGENIVVVSKRLGHATVSITSDIYSHSLPGWQKQAAENFARAMEG